MDVSNMPQSIPVRAWDDACRRFVEDLSPSEQAKFHNASSHSIIEDIRRMEEGLRTPSKVNSWVEKVLPLIEAINQYGAALDVLSNTSSLILCPIWGGIRVVFTLAKEYGTYVDKILLSLSQITEYLPRFSIYERLFQQHERVVVAVSNAFLEVLRFCTEVKSVLRKGKRAFGIYLPVRLSWKTFDRQFGEAIAKIQSHNLAIIDEARIAHMTGFQTHQQALIRSQEFTNVEKIKAQQLEIAKDGFRFLQSLNSDYQTYKDINPPITKGTCQWFKIHPTYLRWMLDESLKLIVVSLGPGCGKSVLARHLIDTHEPMPETSLCYFFFNINDDSSNNAKHAVSAMIHQILLQQPALVGPTVEIASSLPSVTTYPALWDLFSRILRLDKCGQIVCIIDALDECEELSRSRFIRNMSYLCSDNEFSTKIKASFTMRPRSDIIEVLDDGTVNTHHWAMVGIGPWELDDIRSEISCFIEDKIIKFDQIRVKRYGPGNSVSQDLRNHLARVENSTYLWVSQIFKQLEKSVDLSIHDLRDVIDTLPRSVEESYDKILRECPHPQKTRELLQVIIGATRPLKIYEVNLVLSMRNSETSIQDVLLIPDLRISEVLQELSGNFVNVINGKLYLLHSTAKEFLERCPSHVLDAKPPSSMTLLWKNSLDIAESNTKLATACLRYLKFENFQQDPLNVEDKYLFYDSFLDRHLFHEDDIIETRSLIDTYIQKYHFLHYAACNWVKHVTLAAEVDEWMISAGMDLCNIETTLWRTWFTVYVRNGPRYESRPKFPSTLAFVSWLGFAEGVEVLLDQQPTVSQKLTALALAVQRNHKHVTRLFHADVAQHWKPPTPEEPRIDLETALEAAIAAFSPSGIPGSSSLEAERGHEESAETSCPVM